MPDAQIVDVDRLDVGFAPFRWRFAKVRGDDIAAHFAARRQVTPQLWNGRVLLMRDFAIAGSVLRGTYFEASFAELLAWRDWNFPDPEVVNCFAMGALRASDGAYLLGVMNNHTANAGRIYFPAGTPDPDDVRGEMVDLLGNVMRELAEETGLTAADVSIAPGWHAVVDGARVAVMKRIDVPYPASQARTRLLHHLASTTQPELCDVRIVRSPADLDPAMPRFVTAYLAHMWSGGERNRSSSG
jgi:8-oxo-dGTP pyrophosphatase MutT (NUDIX family)